MSDEDNGDPVGGLTGVGDHFISNKLCESYREHIETKIEGMETKILSMIKLTGLVVGLVVTIVQLGLHFLGG